MKNTKLIARKVAFVCCLLVAILLIARASWAAFGQGISLIIHPEYVSGLLLLIVSQFLAPPEATSVKSD